MHMKKLKGNMTFLVIMVSDRNHFKNLPLEVFKDLVLLVPHY